MNIETNQELAAMLEEDRASAAIGKLPRRVLKGPELVLLILLRLYVFLAIPVVAYAFIHAMSVK